MNHKEYIIPIGEEAKDFDEMFIGVIRKQPELIRCKDCLHWDGDSCHVEVWNSEDADSVILDRHADDYCSRAEEKENDN